MPVSVKAGLILNVPPGRTLVLAGTVLLVIVGATLITANVREVVSLRPPLSVTVTLALTDGVSLRYL